MVAASSPAFDDPGLPKALQTLPVATLDTVSFGVIGFDAEGVVRVYNAPEARWSGLPPGEVIGHPLFTEIAQCMNNYLVAQRFDDAAARGLALDATVDYVLTWRMEPTPVKLRLLSSPESLLRYVLIHRFA
jgi:photoactive yellow protein